MIVDWWSIHSWQPVQRMDILLAWPWQKSPIFWDPWFPRDQTIVVSVQNTIQDLLDDVTKPPKLSTETNFSTDVHFSSTRYNYAEKIFTGYISSGNTLLIQQDCLVTLHDES